MFSVSICECVFIIFCRMKQDLGLVWSRDDNKVMVIISNSI